MKKNETEKKTSKRAAQILVEVKPTELAAVTGGGCRSCGLAATAS
jgi:hypothetical protein